MKIKLIEQNEKGTLNLTPDKLVAMEHGGKYDSRTMYYIYDKQGNNDPLVSIKAYSTLKGIALCLNGDYNWHIVRNEHDELILVPTEK